MERRARSLKSNKISTFACYYTNNIQLIKVTSTRHNGYIYIRYIWHVALIDIYQVMWFFLQYKLMTSSIHLYIRKSTSFSIIEFNDRWKSKMKKRPIRIAFLVTGTHDSCLNFVIFICSQYISAIKALCSKLERKQMIKMKKRSTWIRFLIVESR